jgi:cobyrinic acid a,c-diamide synthase
MSDCLFDTLKASELPKCDGLFIGGGFPEMQLESLSSIKLYLKFQFII